MKGESYIARTDELGEIIRFENLEVSGGPVQIFPADPSDDNGNGETDGADGGLQPVEPAGESGPEAAEKALQALAAKLGISADQIDVVSYTSAEWPNGCLGLAGQDEMCTEALVSGYRVELSVNGQTYIARTDEFGNVVRFEQSLN